MRFQIAHVTGLLALAFAGSAFAQETYRLPSSDVVAIVDAPATPSVSLSPQGDRLLLQQRSAMPSIADLSRPMHRLAGMRIDPISRTRFQTSWTTGLEIVDVATGASHAVTPAGDQPLARLGSATWTPDGARVVFTNVTDAGTELWAAEAATGVATRLIGPRMNGTLGGSFGFLGGSERMLVRLVPDGFGAPPAKPAVPSGPLVQETAGRSAMNRTYQDLLQTPYDEELFAHFATTQLAVVDFDGGVTPVGAPDLYLGATASPNGERLLVTRLERPFSRTVPAYSFGKTIDVWDREGNIVHTVATIPVADEVPIGGVQTGPRSVEWIPSEPATLAWVEALDGGDPKAKAEHRDRLLVAAAPFEESIEVTRVAKRFRGAQWTTHRGWVLISDYDRDRRWMTTRIMDWLRPGTSLAVLDDRSQNDSYGDPGRPMTKRLAHGASVAQIDFGALWFVGRGAGPDGERPFVHRVDALNGEKIEYFRSPVDRHTSFVGLALEGGAVFKSESKTSPPNWYAGTHEGEELRPLTQFADPHPQLTGIHKEVLRYERADGVPLSGTLYLPKGYQEGTRLPLVVWAYPREYNDLKTAGQVRVTTNRFTRLSGLSSLMYLTAGYAVLDRAAMPIVGDPETMNDTFAEQIVMAAQAAIDACVDRGVADRDRVGVGGHSYGAFMTANLLIHCDLFKAGVARSGAYNRSLTPFGFQSERRTVWEATDTYVKVSPFFQAHKLNEPILLIHGEVDNNSGTFPLQSKRLFHAMQGLGGTSRYVVLPNESHGYRARESVLHTLAEQFEWFDRHLKGEEPGT